MKLETLYQVKTAQYEAKTEAERVLCEAWLAMFPMKEAKESPNDR